MDALCEPHCVTSIFGDEKHRVAVLELVLQKRPGAGHVASLSLELAVFIKQRNEHGQVRKRRLAHYKNRHTRLLSCLNSPLPTPIGRVRSRAQRELWDQVRVLRSWLVGKNRQSRPLKPPSSRSEKLSPHSPGKSSADVDPLCVCKLGETLRRNAESVGRCACARNHLLKLSQPNVEVGGH